MFLFSPRIVIAMIKRRHAHDCACMTMQRMLPPLVPRDFGLSVTYTYRYTEPLASHPTQPGRCPHLLLYNIPYITSEELTLSFNSDPWKIDSQRIHMVLRHGNSDSRDIYANRVTFAACLYIPILLKIFGEVKNTVIFSTLLCIGMLFKVRITKTHLDTFC